MTAGARFVNSNMFFLKDEKTGTVTFYHGNDPTCTGTRHPANTAFIEADGDVGMARNEGTVEATVVATFFVPAGGPTRVSADRPGNCAF